LLLGGALIAVLIQSDPNREEMLRVFALRSSILDGRAAVLTKRIDVLSSYSEACNRIQSHDSATIAGLQTQLSSLDLHLESFEGYRDAILK
jgi:hypothetical protein